MKQVFKMISILVGVFFIYTQLAFAQAETLDPKNCPEGDKNCTIFVSSGGTCTTPGCDPNLNHGNGDCPMCRVSGLRDDSSRIYRGSGASSTPGATSSDGQNK